MKNLKILFAIIFISLFATVTLSAQNSGTFRGQAIQPDGKILIWGSDLVISGVASGMVARLKADGSRDASFSFCACGFLSVNGVAVQSDGKIVVSGSKQTSDPNTNIAAVSRVNADGSADNTFTTYGNLNSIFGFLRILTVLPDDKILTLSYASFGFPIGNSMSLVAVNPNGGTQGFSIGIGSGNSTFTGLGGLAVNPDGKLYVSRTPAPTGPIPNPLQRYNAGGGADTTFPPPTFSGGINYGVWALGIQPSGDVIAGGGFTTVNGTAARNIVRLSSVGIVDPTFAYNGDPNVGFARIHALPDGKLLVLLNNDILQRLNANGSIDTTFVPATAVEEDFSVDAQGRIVSRNSSGYLRLNSDGSLDTTFVFGQNPTKADFDFDGDGRSDVSVFRPSNGTWYLSRSLAGYSEQNFGLEGDVITPGDFDGDGKTDLAIFRPSTGTWWHKSSISGAFHATQWGQAGDIPLASDFTGDGKADFIVYRSLGAIWFRLGSNGEYSPIQFGTSGDIPLVGDFNGDGKDDPAVYRPSTGTWWYANSADGQFYAIQWGGFFYDIPAPGDYDGDGKTDPAYFRWGTWYALNSSTNYSTYNAMNWGTLGDRPVPGDYDGDGKSDFAIYRPWNNMWFAMRSTSGFFSQQFGLIGDEAIPNAFIP